MTLNYLGLVKPSPLFFGDVQKNWPKFENYSSELIKVMDNDNDYKIHLSQMAFVTGTIASSQGGGSKDTWIIKGN